MVDRIGFGCVLGVALALFASARAQTTHTDKPFVHTASGMVFPVTVGEFKRFRETLDPRGASAGYGYAGQQGRIAATFIVFLPPAEPDFCKTYFDAGHASFVKVHPDAQALQPPEAPAIEGYPAVVGIARRDSYSNPKGGPIFRSESYVYCNVGGKWLVQYDFNYAAAFEASGQIADFIRDLKWTIPPAP